MVRRLLLLAGPFALFFVFSITESLELFTEPRERTERFPSEPIEPFEPNEP